MTPVVYEELRRSPLFWPANDRTYVTAHRLVHERTSASGPAFCGLEESRTFLGVASSMMRRILIIMLATAGRET